MLQQGFANKSLKLCQSHEGEELVLFASPPLSSEFQLPGRVAMETPKRV